MGGGGGGGDMLIIMAILIVIIGMIISGCSFSFNYPERVTQKDLRETETELG